MVGGSNNGEMYFKIIGSREDGGFNSFDEDVEMIRCHNEMDIAEDDDRDLLLMSGDSSSSSNVEDAAVGVLGGRDSHFQRYDLQLVGRWIVQILPFILILLVVFIRQHLHGFIVSLSMAAPEADCSKDWKNWVLVAMSVVFLFYVLAMYWLFLDEGVIYPLLMLPLKVMPPFWHAVFIVMFHGPIISRCYKSSVEQRRAVWVHATKDQVSAAVDLCAICQEKMHSPIFLRCKHIFCEECAVHLLTRI